MYEHYGSTIGDGMLYIVIRTDSNNVPSVQDTHVYASEYAACRVLDNAHLQCLPVEDRGDGHIVRDSDTLLRVLDSEGRQMERYEVLAIVSVVN